MKRIMRVSLFIIAVISSLLAAANPAMAQEFRGSITGRITDFSGAAVPGAKVVVTNSATNVATTTTTDENGIYSVFYLIPGQYTVSVEAQGFKRLMRSGIEVRVADRLTLDLQVEVGAMQQEVQVIAGAPLLETAFRSPLS